MPRIKTLAAFITTLLPGDAVTDSATAKHYAFSGWSWRLFVIDAGYDHVGFFLMSLLIALLK